MSSYTPAISIPTAQPPFEHISLPSPKGDLYHSDFSLALAEATGTVKAIRRRSNSHAYGVFVPGYEQDEFFDYAGVAQVNHGETHSRFANGEALQYTAQDSPAPLYPAHAQGYLFDDEHLVPKGYFEESSSSLIDSLGNLRREHPFAGAAVDTRIQDCLFATHASFPFPATTHSDDDDEERFWDRLFKEGTQIDRKMRPLLRQSESLVTRAASRHARCQRRLDGILRAKQKDVEFNNQFPALFEGAKARLDRAQRRLRKEATEDELALFATTYCSSPRKAKPTAPQNLRGRTGTWLADAIRHPMFRNTKQNVWVGGANDGVPTSQMIGGGW
ncbi:hypothetical protein C8F01DRAFT_1155007 [Mycena amicta]|nr:hypothetical protein C8F01DRAFT_1155007 [Mycena amicta]